MSVFCQATDSITKKTRDELEQKLVDRFGIYKSVDDVLMQAATCEELEILNATFFKQCKLHNVKIRKKKFQLDTHIVFGGAELDASAEEIIFTPKKFKTLGDQRL